MRLRLGFADFPDLDLVALFQTQPFAQDGGCTAQVKIIGRPFGTVPVRHLADARDEQAKMKRLANLHTVLAVNRPGLE